MDVPDKWGEKMRPIDADAMLEYLNLMYDEQHSWRSDYNTGVLGAINYIKHKAPTIDAVSVVRCKDCVFSKVYQNDSSGVMGRFCEAFTQVRMVTHDDFCSYGEKQTDHE